MEPIARTAIEIYNAAVAGAQPPGLLRDVPLATWLDRPLSAFQRIVLVGAGKASMAMAGVLEARLGPSLEAGLVVVPHGYRASFPPAQQAPRRIEVVEAGHPVPDEAGMRAAQRVLEVAAGLGPDDLLLVALSGGGSALWPAFAEGITLDEAQATFRLLLRSGADIYALNTIRRQLSRVGGGGLARAAQPASVLTLAISDVAGDDLATIASGPTVPNPTTRADAVAAVERAGLMDRVPTSVRAHLMRDEPRPPPVSFERVRTVTLGSNHDALAAAQREAERHGFALHRHGGLVTGEARDAGRQLAQQVLAVEADRPVCLLWGGETTVTVTGTGRGGRNQELVLAAALALEGSDRELVFLSGGTDGIDGPTDAAGAWATPQTVQQARARGLDPDEHLARNDAYPFFEALRQLLQPGPTHTNVMDVQIALVYPS
ncbi:MAG: DUF4147 domain-containing protein [Bacteroidota bacterium]